jgi:hypothetical protein
VVLFYYFAFNKIFMVMGLLYFLGIPIHKDLALSQNADGIEFQVSYQSINTFLLGWSDWFLRDFLARL